MFDYDAKYDILTITFTEESGYCDSLGSRMDIMRSFDTGQPVGLVIYGIKDILKECEECEN